jgi:hypothetical protein
MNNQLFFNPFFQVNLILYKLAKHGFESQLLHTGGPPYYKDVFVLQGGYHYYFKVSSLFFVIVSSRSDRKRRAEGPMALCVDNL